MEKKEFQKITKEVFTEYGFIKYQKMFLLKLDIITIVVEQISCRGIRSFDYYFYVNELQGDTDPSEFTNGLLVMEQLVHTPEIKGYQCYEITYEKYTPDQYRKLLSELLHKYFDPYKENAIQHIKDTICAISISLNAREYLGIEIDIDPDPLNPLKRHR